MKPSERIKEIASHTFDRGSETYIKAILDYLDEEYIKQRECHHFNKVEGTNYCKECTPSHQI